MAGIRQSGTSAERQSRQRGGVRPSSGAATPETLRASHLSAAVRTSCDAAPEDGRTPGLPDKSSQLEGRLEISHSPMRFQHHINQRPNKAQPNQNRAHDKSDSRFVVLALETTLAG